MRKSFFICINLLFITLSCFCESYANIVTGINNVTVAQISNKSSTTMFINSNPAECFLFVYQDPDTQQDWTQLLSMASIVELQIPLIYPKTDPPQINYVYASTGFWSKNTHINLNHVKLLPGKKLNLLILDNFDIGCVQTYYDNNGKAPNQYQNTFGHLFISPFPYFSYKKFKDQTTIIDNYDYNFFIFPIQSNLTNYKSAFKCNRAKLNTLNKNQCTNNSFTSFNTPMINFSSYDDSSTNYCYYVPIKNKPPLNCLTNQGSATLKFNPDYVAMKYIVVESSEEQNKTISTDSKAINDNLNNISSYDTGVFRIDIVDRKQNLTNNTNIRPYTAMYCSSYQNLPSKTAFKEVWSCKNNLTDYSHIITHVTYQNANTICTAIDKPGNINCSQSSSSLIQATKISLAEVDNIIDSKPLSGFCPPLPQFQQYIKNQNFDLENADCDYTTPLNTQ